MFRRWLSSFVKKYKSIILEIAKKFGMLILIALVATSIMMALNRTQTSSETENSISIYNPTETVIEGKKISKEEYNEDEDIISKFINYCNEKDIESAYRLLSDDCKEELYPTINDFKNNYYSKLFTSKKEYNLQSWINDGSYHTYKIRFIEDILSTGEYNNSQKGQDYITVYSTNEDVKINLNGYIRKEEIKKESSGDSLKALAVEKKIYMDYEEYTIKIKNMTDSPILLDTGKKKGTIKLVDENKVEYQAYKDKVENLKGTLSPGVIRTLNIRFNKTYSDAVRDKYIEFLDIVVDLEEYNNSNDYTQRESLKIEI